jgi:type IV secretory pathway VirD2 relaxase
MMKASSRRCVVKARYVPIRAGGTRAARPHLAYIERDGVEQDGSKGRLFDGSGDIERETFAAPIAGEKRQFRFIISPEDGNELDLREYTSRLMQRMEKDLGRGLDWAAVCHYNTDNPHVHVVVRGVDRRGAEVRIDRSYISEGLRIRGQELATLELGPRNEFDIKRQLTKEVAQERLTTIDRRLGELVSPMGTIDMPAIANAPRLSRPHALARLDILEQLRLVERTSPTSWRVAEGWQETLKQLGERGDIIKRMHDALQGRASAYRVFEPRAGAAVEGVIKVGDRGQPAPFGTPRAVQHRRQAARRKVESAARSGRGASEPRADASAVPTPCRGAGSRSTRTGSRSYRRSGRPRRRRRQAREGPSSEIRRRSGPI